MRILIIEDDIEIISWLERKLNNHIVVIATTVTMAIQRLKEDYQYDLVLLDYGLGAETTEKVAEYIKDVGYKAKIIITTGNPGAAQSLNNILADAICCDKFKLVTELNDIIAGIEKTHNK